MANTIVTPVGNGIIAKEALFQLQNNLVLSDCVHREYKKEFVKVGDSISIRKPVKFTSTASATMSIQDVTEGVTTLTIDNRQHVAWEFLTADLTLKIEEYSKRYVEPACIRLANDVEAAISANYSAFWLSSGTPGTTPSSFAALGTTAQYMDDFAIPDDGMRKLVFDPAARWSMADALKGIYDNSMPKDFVRKGLLGRIAQFDIYGAQNTPRHTCGARVDDPAILINNGTLNGNGTPQANTITLTIDGFAADTANSLRVGDSFTIANVFSVNPISKVSTGRLQDFTCQAALTPAAGAGTISVRPNIVTTGPYQNVTAAPIDNALLTFRGTNSTTFTQNLAFHRNAMALVFCPLALPDGAAYKARATHDGISIRVIKDFSMVDDKDIIRLDILYGTDPIYPELGQRLWGQ